MAPMQKHELGCVAVHCAAVVSSDDSSDVLDTDSDVDDMADGEGGRGWQFPGP